MSPTRRLVALDLGTARTRSLSGHAIADRPSAVMGRASGVADVVRPIRHGMVADPGACVRLVRLVLQDTRLYDGRPPARVLAGVPIAASPSDRRAVHAAVSEIAGCEVTLVEEPLAAAVGVGLDVLDPQSCLVLDVGAGIVEAAAIGAGAVVDAVSLQLGATTAEGLPPYALESVVEMTAGLLRRLPTASRSRGLVVTGGGAHQELLLSRLRTALRLRISVAPQPQHATIRGLMRLCLQPALAEGLGLRAR
ncbi:rod shape-determining protein [Nonomuraea sp. NPDC052116]|uniref:rod shape-determining protein n=1 Tax=Nonomuraea sp. NPDC052116 TaxID=3155665 RepID=UPI00341935AB